MPFAKLLGYIEEKTKNHMVNVIITDAGFEINESKLIDAAYKLSGIILFITNEVSSSVKKLAEGKLKNKLYYIQADKAFKVV